MKFSLIHKNNKMIRCIGKNMENFFERNYVLEVYGEDHRKMGHAPINEWEGKLENP